MNTLIEPSTADSLLFAARQGQPEAWGRFVHLYGPLVYRWVRRSGFQSSDAADVTQDVLMSVSKDLATFDPSRPDAKFRGWLWTITRRRMADSLRNRPAEQGLGSRADQFASPDQQDEPPTDASLDRHTLLTQAVAIYRDRFDSKRGKRFGPPSWKEETPTRSPIRWGFRGGPFTRHALGFCNV